MEKYIVFDIETTGLKPEESEITCICAIANDGSLFKLSRRTLTERELIIKFNEFILEKGLDCLLVTANGRFFDIPFIIKRGIFNEVDYRGNLSHLIVMNDFDILNDILKKRISLNRLSEKFGFGLKTGDGLHAIDLFYEKRFDELLDYCMNDVELTKQIFLKYKEGL